MEEKRIMSTASKKKKLLPKKKVKEEITQLSDDTSEVQKSEEKKEKKEFSWDEEYVVGVIEEVDRWGNALIIKACRRGTKWYKDVRINYIDKKGDQLFHPTKKGFCIDDEFMDELEMLIAKPIGEIIKSHQK
jgi:soluble cytochrome b562